MPAAIWEKIVNCPHSSGVDAEVIACLRLKYELPKSVAYSSAQASNEGIHLPSSKDPSKIYGSLEDKEIHDLAIALRLSEEEGDQLLHTLRRVSNYCQNLTFPDSF